MLWTKFKYENKQRAITQKLNNLELQFMCTALPLDEIKNKQRAITKKKKKKKAKKKKKKKKANKSYGSCALHSPLRSIHP